MVTELIFLQCGDLPRERKNLLGIFPEQSSLGSVGEHQDHVDVARPEFDQVAGVRDVCQLCHLHKVLLRRTAAWTDKKELYISMDYRDGPPPAGFFRGRI